MAVARDRLDAGFDPEYVVCADDTRKNDDFPVCAICTNVTEDPAEASCGHVFCRAHIEEWLRTHDTCPLDRLTVTLKDCANDAYKGHLDALRLKCQYYTRGCDHLNSLDSTTYRAHVDECGFAPSACTWDDCPEVGINSKDLPNHLDLCPFRVVPCDLKCGEEMAWNKLDTHIKEKCLQLPLPCPQSCNAVVARGEIDNHTKTVCPHTLVPCPIQTCTNVLRRDAIQSHLADIDCIASHVLSLSSSLVALQQSHEETNAQIAKKVHTLERRAWMRLQKQQINAHSTRVSAMAAQGSFLYTGSWDTTIKIWDVGSIEGNEPAACIMTFYGHDDWVRTLTVQGTRLFSGSKDKTIKIWDLTVTPERAYAACLVTLTGHEGVVTVLAVSDDGKRLFSSSWDNTIRVWDIADDGESANCVHTLAGHEDWGRALAVHGDRLYSGSKDYAIKVWDVTPGNKPECVASLKGHNGVLTTLLVSGDRLYSASWDNTIRVWDISGGQRDARCTNTLEGHTDDVTALSVTKDWLFSGSDDNTIRLWDTAEAKAKQGPTATFQVDRVITLACSEERLYSSSSNDTVFMWT